MSSRRLPGKVLKPLLGVPMLLRQVERLRRATTFGRMLVATSTDPSDDVLAELCARHRIECFRGSLDDVLDRFYRAARPYDPEHVVRVTGDCPLIDPGVLDDVVRFYLAGDFDYASNAVEPTFPDGLDVEVFRFSALETAWQEAQLPSQREHVTLFIYKHPERFRVGHYRIGTDLSHMRWTVDRAEDFEFVSRVFEALYPADPSFTMQDVLRYLQLHPEAAGVNAGTERNEGLKRSLERERPQDRQR
jgi:spore coat polysaccharide biosynthesis protein SpsF